MRACLLMSVSCCRLQQCLEQQQAALPALVSATAEAQELCPPAAVLNTTALAKAFARASALLGDLHSKVAAAQQALTAAVAAVPTQEQNRQAPLLITPALDEAMQGVASTLAAAQAELLQQGSAVQPGLETPGIEGDMTLARLHPAWLPLQQQLWDAAEQCAVPTASVTPRAAVANSAMQGTTVAGTAAGTAIDAPGPLSAAIEQGLQAALLWSQSHGSAPAGSSAPAADDEQLASATAQLQRVCASAHLRALQHQLERIADAVAQQEFLAALQASGESQQLHGLLAMAQIVASGAWAAMQHGVLLHAAAAKLAIQTTAVFAAYLKDGFGSGHADDDTEAQAASGGAKGEGALLHIVPAMLNHVLSVGLI